MNFKAVLAQPKTAPSAQTYKSITFIWIVWSTLYVYLCLPAQLSIKWFCTMVDVAEINDRHTVEQISCCLNIYWLPHKLTKYIQSYNLELKSSQQRYQNRCIFLFTLMRVTGPGGFYGRPGGTRPWHRAPKPAYYFQSFQCGFFNKIVVT